MGKDFSRRSFLKTGTAAALGMAMTPEILMGKSKKKAAPKPLDRKLKILGVGIGGRGAQDHGAAEYFRQTDMDLRGRSEHRHSDRDPGEGRKGDRTSDASEVAGQTRKTVCGKTRTE